MGYVMGSVWENKCKNSIMHLKNIEGQLIFNEKELDIFIRIWVSIKTN